MMLVLLYFSLIGVRKNPNYARPAAPRGDVPRQPADDVYPMLIVFRAAFRLLETL